MNIEHIFEFITLAETKNYLMASDILFIAQSALSRHIQGLEHELGAQLFDRTTRSVELTECGKIFLKYALDLKSLNSNFKSELSQHMRNDSNTIIAGCMPFSFPYHIPDLLAKFVKENKDFGVSLINSVDVNQLLDHTVDFLFLRHFGIISENENIELVPFASDTLAALLPKNHPLANRTSIALSELKNEKFLCFTKDTQAYNLSINPCLAEQFDPKTVFAGSQECNVIAMVKENIGVGLLAKKPLQYLDCSGISIVDIEPTISTSISLAYLKTRKNSTCAAQFINFVSSFAEAND